MLFLENPVFCSAALFPHRWVLLLYFTRTLIFSFRDTQLLFNCSLWQMTSYDLAWHQLHWLLSTKGHFLFTQGNSVCPTTGQETAQTFAGGIAWLVFFVPAVVVCQTQLLPRPPAPLCRSTPSALTLSRLPPPAAALPHPRPGAPSRNIRPHGQHRGSVPPLGGLSQPCTTC